MDRDFKSGEPHPCYSLDSAEYDSFNVVKMGKDSSRK